MAHLTLNVMGELQVFIDNIPISTFKSDKVRALLAYVVVESNAPHRREKLVGLLWPDCPEQAARHNLRQALFNLRLAVGDHIAKPPYLLINRDTIQFNRKSDYSLDLDQFNAKFSAWEENQERENTTSPSHLSQLEEVVQLYQGEFLQQFYLDDSVAFEEWILVQREALHRRMINVLTTLADEYELDGHFQLTRRYALRQLELDPWREEAHCQIMRSLALEGQRSAALAQYEICRKTLADELGVEPSPKTRDLYEQIRLGTIKPKTASPTPLVHAPVASIQNLPLPPTPFIGREQELADLGQLFSDPDCQCITLLGPGGIGKTRLALQAADGHRSKFIHGAAFVPLVSVGSIEAAVPAIANGVGFAFYGPTDPKIQLLNYLRDKQMLLIMDNVEHLLEKRSSPGTIAELIMDILTHAQQVKLLITSREALNLRGEWTYEIHGLDYPEIEPMKGADEYGAVALFIQHARRARPGFMMSVDDKMGVVRLCRLVEGMPLAIELAASWMRLLSPMEIANEIEHNLDFLNAQMRDLPERHRSMRAVFDHSWQGLSTDEQRVLCRLSVFRGGFHRLAAEQVAGASLPILSSLLIQSLVRRTGTGRYDLHELIRQYAALRLAEDSRELNLAQEQHSLYYLGLLEEKGTQLFSHHQKETLNELTGEMDNLRTAWGWAVSHQKIIPLYRASTTFWYLFELTNWFKEGELTFWRTAEELQANLQDIGLEDIVQQTVLQAMFAHSSSFKFRQGRSEEAYATIAPCASFLQTTLEQKDTDPFPAIYAFAYLGIVCWELGRFSEAKESLQESLGLARKYGKRWYEALVNEFLGVIAHDQGEYSQAAQYLSEALTIFRQLGDPSFTAHVLSYLGRSLQVLGEYQEAEKLLRESLGFAREMNYRFGCGLALDALGQVAYSQGKQEEAYALYLESAAIFREMGDTHRLSRTLNHQGMTALALNQDAEARNAFMSSLRMAQEGGLIPSTLNALAGLTALETHQKANQEMLETIIYILQHPSSNEEAKVLAVQLRTELESRLPREEIETARQYAGAKNLEELVDKFLTDA